VQQRVAGQQEDELSLSLRLIWALARRPLWLAGIAVDLGAYCFEAAALGFGSIIVVGPLMASGLLFALPFASFRTGQRVTRKEMIPAVMITVGLARVRRGRLPGRHHVPTLLAGPGPPPARW